MSQLVGQKINILICAKNVVVFLIPDIRSCVLYMRKIPN